MDWLAWLLLGIAVVGAFVAVLSAVMLSSAIDQRQEAVNDGPSGAACQARGVERVHELARRGDLASPRVEAAQAAHE